MVGISAAYEFAVDGAVCAVLGGGIRISVGGTHVQVQNINKDRSENRICLI